MAPTSPVIYTTPDGVERTLRFTFGAQRRIVERLGCPAMEALQKYGNGALPELLYACMFDEDGRPPEKLNPVKFAEAADPETAVEMTTAFFGAINKGKIPKNELEVLIRKMMSDQFLLTNLGSNLGLLLGYDSGSAAPSSGISPSENSQPSLNNSDTSSESPANLAA